MADPGKGGDNPPPYAPPPQGYGYPPPPQGGAPQPQPWGQAPGGYAPQPGFGPPPPQGYYPPPPQQMHSSQSSNNVVVVNPGAAQATQTVIVERRGVNHALHCIISLFFWPWIIVWFILCITDN